MQNLITRYATRVSLKSEEAVTCVDTLIKKGISAFGCPDEIHSDQGRKFLNRIKHDLGQRLRINRKQHPYIQPIQTQVRGFLGLSIHYFGST